MVFHGSGLIAWGGADDSDTVFNDIFYVKISKQLTFVISNFVKLAQNMNINSTEKKLGHEMYVDQLKDLFMDKTFTDISIQVEDETFPAHRCIIAARCKYFKNMLTSNSFSSYEYWTVSRWDEGGVCSDDQHHRYEGLHV